MDWYDVKEFLTITGIIVGVILGFIVSVVAAGAAALIVTVLAGKFVVLPVIDYILAM